MTRQNNVIALVIVFLVILTCFAGCKKKAVEHKLPAQKVEKKTSSAERKAVDFDILTDIKMGQAVLENQDAGYYLKKTPMHNGKKGKDRKEWTSKKLEDFNVLLAVKQIGTNKTKIIKLTQKGTQAPNGYAIANGKMNGVNTPFNITYPSGHVVLALKRVVKSGNSFSEVVYTPFTPEINTKELRAKGMQYLIENLQAAENELRTKKVRSKAYGGLVADAVPGNVALTLSLIEHIDPTRFESGEPIEKLMNEVLVVVAANERRAYAYSVSKAGARGLFQFIPRTYNNISRQYPNAALDVNFVRGMEDHHNAAKASLLLFDSDLSYLKNSHRQFLKKNPQAMGKYLAAAYNGGSPRASNRIQVYKGAWERHVLPETQCYLKKFDATWKLLYPS